VNQSDSFAPKVRGRDGIDNGPRLRPCERQPVLTQKPPDNGGIAMTIPDEVIRSLVEVQEW
jgi:hypothetical protein